MKTLSNNLGKIQQMHILQSKEWQISLIICHKVLGLLLWEEFKMKQMHKISENSDMTCIKLTDFTVIILHMYKHKCADYDYLKTASHVSCLEPLAGLVPEVRSSSCTVSGVRRSRLKRSASFCRHIKCQNANTGEY